MPAPSSPTVREAPAPPRTPQVPHRLRPVVAALLAVAPVLWVVEELLHHHDEASLVVGIVSVPFDAAWLVAVVVLTRRCTRWALPAGAVIGLGLIGLAMVHGMEFAQWAQVQAGADRSAIDAAVDDAGGLPTVLVIGMFFGGGLLGTLLLAVTFWRSSWVPRGVAVLTAALAVLDLLLDWNLAGLLANAAAGVWLAATVLRTGAAIPDRERILVSS